MSTIRVVLVEDHELVRRGISLVLASLDGFEVVGEAGGGVEALALINSMDPDIVLSDARMPRLDGPGLVKECAQHHPGIPVVMLTTFDDDDVVRAAVDAGAAGFLLKDSTPEAIADALRAAVRGEMTLDPRITRSLLASQPVDPLASLTPTEREVASMLATGAANAEIASELHMSHGTVKNHVSSLLRKMHQSDRTRLALYLAGLDRPL